MAYKKIKLKNNLRLILAPLKETKAVTILVLLPVGSRYESKNINGVSHFVEHLMFKGTERRPTSLDLTKTLDSVGAEFNAFTGKDQTGYYIKISADKVELAFDLLSDILFNSLFKSEDIEKERGVITEEINMFQDNPLMLIHGLFEQTVFPNSSLGQLISGPKSVIKKITRDQILNYKNKFYCPKNMVITVAGNFSQQKILSLADKYFGLNGKKMTEVNFESVKLTQNSPRINLFFKDTKQVQMCLGFSAYSLADKNIFPLYLLAVILGGNMSSRLFTTIREKYGLAYYIKAGVETYQDTGLLMVQAGLDKKRAKQGIRLILEELKNIKDNGVSHEELLAAKEFLKGKLVLDLEDSESIADWYGRQELLLGKTFTPAEKIKKVSSISVEQIKKVAQDIIKQRKLNLALISPFKDRADFFELLKFEENGPKK